MEAENGALDLRFTHRGASIRLAVSRSATLRELGEQLQLLTGVAPHTMKLLVPGAARPALQPFADDDQGHLVLGDCGLAGKLVRLMGSLPSEVIEASQAAASDSRMLGFAEEEDRARQRSGPVSRSVVLPQGQYVFAAFRTLELPGVQMTPPASSALKLMHALAADRGIVAIMNKYKWRVGVMTEMAPEGLVGISPKCLLGFNKNHGEEISLRLRTDDLRGFRKYQSIKTTLLHELAHMVHDEHDDDFYRLDRKLNKEYIELDWTRSKGNSVNNMKYVNEMSIDEFSHHIEERGRRLGGDSSAALMDARTAAAVAALRRYQAPIREESRSLSNEPENEPDPDDKLENDPDPDDKLENEPDPDDKAEKEPQERDDSDDLRERFRLLSNSGRDLMEADPIEKSESEPDPGDKVESDAIQEPDPDDKMEIGRVSVEQIDISGDPELERIYEAATSASSRLQKSLAKLKAEGSPSEFSIACQTLFTILRNVMEHPQDEKYRRIRKANALFQQRVARFQAAIELLQLVGFTDEAENRDCFVLRHSDPGLLWLARSSLEAMA